MNQRTIRHALRATVIFVLFAGSIILFQNFEQPDIGSTDAVGAESISAAELRDAYALRIKSTIDYWETQDIAAYSTGHICQPTTVSYSFNTSAANTPYLTPKIHRMGILLESLAAIYPRVEPVYQNKILKISRNIYFWLYRQIDWTRKLVADDYGLCYKGISTAYSHLTTPHTIMGFAAFRKILPPTDPSFAKLTDVIGLLAQGHLETTDGWMTPIDKPPLASSANFMALNLSVVAALNAVRPGHAYLRDHLDHRLRTDYAWIRQAWSNYSSEQKCGAPLLFGGWSHQTPELAAKSFGATFSCEHFKLQNTDKISKGIRSYYYQKVSYHTITTKGLLGVLDTLQSRRACELVSYGSQGACVEMATILRGAGMWLYGLIQDDGGIPTAFDSFPVDEFGYSSGRAGTVIGAVNLIEILHADAHQVIDLGPVFKAGYPDQPQLRLTLPEMSARTLKALQQAMAQSSVSTLYLLKDAPYLAAELFE